MRSRKLSAVATGLALVCIGLVGCGDTSSDTGNAGIPSHRGPATANTKKLKPSRSSSKTAGGVR